MQRKQGPAMMLGNMRSGLPPDWIKVETRLFSAGDLDTLNRHFKFSPNYFCCSTVFRTWWL